MFHTVRKRSYENDPNEFGEALIGVANRRLRSNVALRMMATVLAFALTPALHAQSGKTDPTAVNSQTKANKKSTRVAGVIPAFNAEDDLQAPALSDSQKFHLFTRTIKDPFNLIMPAVNAVILSSAGASSGYGNGFGGFTKRYAASIGDSVSGNFFRLYAFPVLLHEDPRYFRAGHGSIARRTGHVFASTVWTRKDDKTFRFNWSKLLASVASSALSNAYYPAENRGVKLTVSRIGLSYLGEIGYNGLKEFWADIARKK